MASIPDEAVEAAAKVLDPHTMSSGGALAGKFREATRAEARAILEAAAPYLMAQAWDEGVEVGQGGWCLLETPCGVCEHCTTPGPSNPYRLVEDDRG
ncbi:hypothetical protein PBI_BRIDGETTE_37 [Arthrobacter phage Bridgette]|uniref:Uncharacterized protein n=1 Tax=Arthrobacter phage Bridgette TaxID=2419949 RepID=A0A3G2KE85_9CAUD|nr:hypothetical protein HOU46_gp37 [Arthrobacter phage Bridgette]AYN57303.1 hypothetical protein PBI_BRIDGETTE_37 [Arthrobacter phage Bridgette]